MEEQIVTITGINAMPGYTLLNNYNANIELGFSRAYDFYTVSLIDCVLMQGASGDTHIDGVPMLYMNYLTNNVVALGSGSTGMLAIDFIVPLNKGETQNSAASNIASLCFYNTRLHNEIVVHHLRNVINIKWYNIRTSSLLLDVNSGFTNQHYIKLKYRGFDAIPLYKNLQNKIRLYINNDNTLFTSDTDTKWHSSFNNFRNLVSHLDDGVIKMTLIFGTMSVDTGSNVNQVLGVVGVSMNGNKLNDNLDPSNNVQIILRQTRRVSATRYCSLYADNKQEFYLNKMSIPSLFEGQLRILDDTYTFTNEVTYAYVFKLFLCFEFENID